MRNLPFIFALCLAGFVCSLVIPEPEQLAVFEDAAPRKDRDAVPMPETEINYPRRIAVIGSGITGAIAANRLYEGLRAQVPAGQQPSITVFERGPVVGGRIRQAYAYDDYQYPVDTCAATFALSDTCIVTAATNVGLLLEPLGRSLLGEGVGIWNGKEIVSFVEEDGFRGAEVWAPYRQRKWGQRYGNAPQNFAENVTTLRFSFDALLPSSGVSYGRQRVPGKPNLSREIREAGLQGYVQNFFCTDETLASLDSEEGRLFALEVLNSAGRERFFEDYMRLNVLEFFLGFEQANPSFISGGNLQLIDRLLRLSTAEVRLGTEVLNIARDPSGSLQLESVSNESGGPYIEVFDAVVIAASLELANLTFTPPLQNAPGFKQRYKDSFVTHFTTASELNGSYFNQFEAMPQNVLTTYDPSDQFSDSPAPFFSLTLLRRLLDPRTERIESLYKLVSREEISFSDIEQFLLANESSTTPVISWIHQEPLPRSVPVLEAEFGRCEEILEEIEIAPRIYYAGGGEQVVASAEFGCRMGENVANLVIDGRA